MKDTKSWQKPAEKEGWSIFDLDSQGILEIEKIDEQDKFKYDEDAVAFVRKHAEKGSGPHAEAIRIHDHYAKQAKEYRERM